MSPKPLRLFSLFRPSPVGIQAKHRLYYRDRKSGVRDPTHYTVGLLLISDLRQLNSDVRYRVVLFSNRAPILCQGLRIQHFVTKVTHSFDCDAGSQILDTGCWILETG